MRIMTFGDVVGTDTVEFFEKKIWQLRSQEHIDFVIANGENATSCQGVCAIDAARLLDAGIDLLTMGNHTYGIKGFSEYMDAHTNQIIRPINFSSDCGGVGYAIREVDGYRLLCINVSGQMFMAPCDNPFFALDKLLQREEGKYDFAICDIHAESGSEKMALGYDFDGKIHIIYGTHTHIPTSDARIMPNGTGYITDIGMSGPINGIIGTNKDVVVKRFREEPSEKFTVAEGKIVATAIIFDLNVSTKRVSSIKRIKIE